jgi:hypothetical protein
MSAEDVKPERASCPTGAEAEMSAPRRKRVPAGAAKSHPSRAGSEPASAFLAR